MKLSKMVFGQFRKLWEARGHQITELKYMGTPIHWHLFPLIAQHGESFLGKKSAVFEATLTMKPCLGKLVNLSEAFGAKLVSGSVDDLEWDSITQCDNSEQSIDDEDCDPRSRLVSSQIVATEREDTAHSDSTAEAEGGVDRVHKGVDVQASQPQPSNPGTGLNMPHTKIVPETQKTHGNEASGGHNPRRKRSADDTEDEERRKVRRSRKLIWDSDGSI